MEMKLGNSVLCNIDPVPACPGRAMCTIAPAMLAAVFTDMVRPVGLCLQAEGNR
jgi:hypothetical protein